MPATNHVEKRFAGSEAVRDVVIGMSDGLTVPFALAAGLPAAVGSTSVIVTAGHAEIAAGAIAMGLGGYLAARTDAQHFGSEEAREKWEIENKRNFEITVTREIFTKFGLSGPVLEDAVNAIASDHQKWADFMMRLELGLEKPDPRRAPISAGTIAVSYLVGGLVPLVPYMLVANMSEALKISVGVTGVALLVFGAVKGHFAGVNIIKSALQTGLVGGLAACAAFWLAHLFG